MARQGRPPTRPELRREIVPRLMRRQRELMTQAEPLSWKQARNDANAETKAWYEQRAGAVSVSGWKKIVFDQRSNVDLRKPVVEELDSIKIVSDWTGLWCKDPRNLPLRLAPWKEGVDPTTNTGRVGYSLEDATVGHHNWYIWNPRFTPFDGPRVLSLPPPKGNEIPEQTAEYVCFLARLLACYARDYGLEGPTGRNVLMGIVGNLTPDKPRKVPGAAIFRDTPFHWFWAREIPTFREIHLKCYWKTLDNLVDVHSDLRIDEALLQEIKCLPLFEKLEPELF